MADIMKTLPFPDFPTNANITVHEVKQFREGLLQLQPSIRDPNHLVAQSIDYVASGLEMLLDTVKAAKEHGDEALRAGMEHWKVMMNKLNCNIVEALRTDRQGLFDAMGWYMTESEGSNIQISDSGSLGNSIQPEGQHGICHSQGGKLEKLAQLVIDVIFRALGNLFNDLKKNFKLVIKIYVGSVCAVFEGSTSFITEGYKGAIEGGIKYGKKGADIGGRVGEYAGPSVGTVAGSIVGAVIDHHRRGIPVNAISVGVCAFFATLGVSTGLVKVGFSIGLFKGEDSPSSVKVSVCPYLARPRTDSIKSGIISLLVPLGVTICMDAISIIEDPATDGVFVKVFKGLVSADFITVPVSKESVQTCLPTNIVTTIGMDSMRASIIGATIGNKIGELSGELVGTAVGGAIGGVGGGITMGSKRGVSAASSSACVGWKYGTEYADKLFQ